MRNNLQAPSLGRLLQFHCDEGGAAYSISVVMMIPIIIAFITLAIEIALLFLSQQSLNTATQTSMHASQAWLSHQEALMSEGQDLERMVHRAVVRSLVPFASARASAAEKSTALDGILGDLGLGTTATQRLARKQTTVAESTRVTISPDRKSTAGWTIRVEYDVPLWTPVIGRLFQNGATRERPSRTIVSEAWLPLGEQDIERKSIGIPYSPHLATDWPK